MKTIKILGKGVPVFALVLAGLATIGTAALLTYYGAIVSTQTVNQAVRLDGLVCADQYGTGCTVTSSNDNVEGTTVLDSPHTVKNFASVSANAQINSASDCTGVTTVVTSTITESSSANDYSNPENSLVAFDVSGKTLNDLLSQTLQYTDDVVSNPGYYPNINVYITNGVNHYVVQAWGNNVGITTGVNTVSFSDLFVFPGSKGYGATVNMGPGLWPAIMGAHSDSFANYNTVADVLADYGTWTVEKVEVRAQAGGAGGQIDIITQFIANGLTANIPDMVNLNGQTLTLLPSETISFGVSTTYPINMLQTTCTQTTQVVPV